MLIQARDIEDMERDPKRFIEIFSEYTKEVFWIVNLWPRLSPMRVLEAHGAWKKDLERVGENERHLEDGLDHFKRAGHLAFWIRRMSPVVEAHDLTGNFSDPKCAELDDNQKALKALLFGYANEYIAFDFGLAFCKYYELAKHGGSERAANLKLNDDYFKVMCHFLKFKNVSPHAMFLIYKSLFVV